MASSELVPAGENSPIAVLRMDANELQELIRENVGAEGITPRDLDRVKVPSGGGTTWEVPTIEGDKALKSIQGVIVHRATRRAYWPNKYDGSGEQPDCYSDDGVSGQGDPGGACAECPFNEFESAEDGISKACKEMRQLFVLTPDDLIPIVVTVPPGSLANVKAYFLRLMRSGIKATDVITNIALEKATSKGGIAFARVTLTAGDRLDSEAAARLRQYAAALEPAFQAAARVERDEVDGES